MHSEIAERVLNEKKKNVQRHSAWERQWLWVSNHTIARYNSILIIFSLFWLDRFLHEIWVDDCYRNSWENSQARRWPVAEAAAAKISDLRCLIAKSCAPRGPTFLFDYVHCKRSKQQCPPCARICNFLCLECAFVVVSFDLLFCYRLDCWVPDFYAHFLCILIFFFHYLPATSCWWMRTCEHYTCAHHQFIPFECMQMSWMSVDEQERVHRNPPIKEEVEEFNEKKKNAK